MIARMRSVFGWIRGHFGDVEAPPARARKRPTRVPSRFDALERREVLSTATFSPFATLPGVVTPITPTMAAISSATMATSVATAASTTVHVVPPVPSSSSVLPTAIGAATTPAYYYGQAVVQPPVVVQSPVAPVSYAGQPVVAASAAGISATAADTDYVQSLYRNVLNRVGTPNEVAAWVVQMEAGVTVPAVAGFFVNSLEHREDEVYSYYQEFLHRTPDKIADNWVNALRSGASEESVVEAILDLPEYQAAHQDPGQFIQGLYNDVLGRPADPAGYAAWGTALAAGESRQAAVASFVRSPEAVDQVIDSYYAGYLHRQPDLATSAQWAAVLESPDGSASDVAIGLLSSPEFVQDSQQA